MESCDEGQEVAGFDGHDFIYKHELTCYRCDARQTCEYVWDLYNQGGECLASK